MIRSLDLGEAEIKEFIDSKFDRTCDICHIELKDLESSSNHYMLEHKIPIGYLKCCGYRLKSPGSIIDHINWHINPETSQM